VTILFHNVLRLPPEAVMHREVAPALSLTKGHFALVKKQSNNQASLFFSFLNLV
jgi:hypothetical protein